MITDDKRLAEGLVRGETAAQEEFLRQYAPPIFQLIVRMTGQELDAEELTQDTLLGAMHHIGTYDATRASLQTWISRIAYRLTLNHLRRQAAPTVGLDDVPKTMSRADEQAMQRAFEEADDGMTELLRQAIERLPPDEQTLVTLFYYDDLPLKQIAYIVEAPPGTLATRLHRIRRKLYHIIRKLQQQ